MSSDFWLRRAKNRIETRTLPPCAITRHDTLFRGSLTLTLTLALAACTGARGPEGPIKIGYLGPLTGDAVSYGLDTVNGTKMAVDEVNTGGGINGRQVQLIAEDARCTGADAASAAQKLVNIDGVVAIIGGQCSGETLAASPIVEAAQVPMISPVSSSPDVTHAGDFVFRDYPSDALKTKAMAKHLKEEGYGKLAMISENTDFAMAFRNALKGEMGKESIVFDEIVEPGTKDFRTLMTRLQEEEFDMFFPNAQSDAVMAAMMTQLREAGLSQQAISHDVADSVTLGEIAKDAVEGMLIINVPPSGGGEFGQRFTERFGVAQATLAFAAHAYDAANVLMQAITTVGTDGPAIRDYLYNLDRYDGIVGTFRFDENGDVIGIPYGLKQFQDGGIVKIGDVSVE